MANVTDTTSKQRSRSFWYHSFYNTNTTSYRLSRTHRLATIHTSQMTDGRNIVA